MVWPTTRDDLQAAAAQLAVRVFRTDLSQPGFALLDLGTDGTADAFRQLLVRLAEQLGHSYERTFGSPLPILSASRFDQQASTEAHRDGGPDESILVLGYEPTEVVSRVFLLDYTRCAVDQGLTPTEFLERFNPMARDTRELLDPYTTEVEFDPAHYRVLVINNSALPLEQRHRGMLGVLHKAVIPEPRLEQTRVVNSLMLATRSEGAGPSAEAVLQLLTP
jgi:hypothetical protein